MSFIGEQLQDFIERADFIPFEIALLNGFILQVGYPEAVTLLSGGFLFHEQDATHRIVPFESVLALQTIFDPPPSLANDEPTGPA
jgi:hypothetical protein